MSQIIAHLQEDLQELQQLVLKLDNPLQKTSPEDEKILNEKSIYLENTYTLEELQAEGLNNAEIINCLEAVGIFLGYSDIVRNQIPEAIDHLMMALHYNPYSKDALTTLLDVFMENMEEENRSQKVYGLLSQMYDFDKEEDKKIVIDCALEAGFVQLCSEITLHQIEK